MSADLVFSNMIAKVFEGIRIPQTWQGFVSCYVLVLFHLTVESDIQHTEKTGRTGSKNSYRDDSNVYGFGLSGGIICDILWYTDHISVWRWRGAAGRVTYAEYARQGFFQLLVVCILNLGAVLTMEHFFQRNRAVDAVLTVISVCTIIMTASSGWRMILYIRAYQLTFLRVVVLVALAVITLLMAGTICYIWNRRFPLFQYGMAVVCVSYVLFAFAHVDAGIAAYDLAQIENGNTAGDYSYLSCLSTDAAPVIAEYLKEHPTRVITGMEYITGSGNICRKMTG